MFAYIRGDIVEITEDNVVLDVGGIGYNIHISPKVAASLPDIGNEVKLHTYTLVREDAFSLYGFLTAADLAIFKKCITVNGIGPKGALAILSVMDAEELRYAILSGDAKAIASAPGIGKKTAERLILDLKDKLDFDENMIRMEISGQNAVAGMISEDRNVQEAIEALVALGYGQTESMRAIGQIEGAEGMDSSLLIKEALKKLF